MVPVAILLGAHPGWTEHHYSRTLYPVWQTLMGGLSSLIPFPLAELCLVALLAWVLFVLIRGCIRCLHPSERYPRKTFLRRVGLFLAKLCALISLIIAMFLLFWGFNYQRQSWALNHGWKATGGSHTQLVALARRLAIDLAADRATLPESPGGSALAREGTWTSDALLQRVNQAWDALSASDVVLLPHSVGAKRFIGSDLMSAFSIGGVYIPWTGEALVNAGPADFTVPFSAAHEIAHQRGWAREDEANFLAFLVLRGSPDPDLRYAGEASAFLYVASALQGLSESELAELRSLLPDGFRRDRQALDRYWSAWRGPLAAAGTAINDHYLKAQGQGEGVKSYGRMVDLLLAWNRR